uniref:Uncharacterized protein n=1 Tax=Gopherus evgoodei TaxID=1825980 RepID=A0A8C4YQ56_9SAUR
MVALLLTATLLFFSIWHIIVFDELQTDYKNPIDHCNTLSPLVFPEYPIYAFFCVMLLCAAEWLTLGLNMPVLLIRMMACFGLSSTTTVPNSLTTQPFSK